jgi:hypothetical protein
MHAQQHLAVADHWPIDLLEPQYVLCVAVGVLDDGLHRCQRLRRLVRRRRLHRISDVR